MKPVAPLAPIEPAFAETATFIDATLEALLPQPAGPEARLLEAMHYAAMGGTERLRAFLVLQCGRLFGVDRRALGRVAASVECLHAYSQVHDDLPAMDDDDLRRGRPSLHKAFDEATAILAGDALVTLAFALLASPETHGDPFVRCELIAKLSSAAGHSGMVGGQIMDLSMQGGQPGLAEMTRFARMKTAALITFSCEAGAIMGKGSGSARLALVNYGQELGLAYQIADELADLEGEASEGATPTKDARAKATVASILGRDRARAQAEALAAQAAAHLDLFDEKADLLRAAAPFVIRRKA